MAKLTRDTKTGNWFARKVISEDCRADFGKREDKPIWSGHLTEAQVRGRFGQWLAAVEGRITAIRERGAQPPRQLLTDFDVDRLAALWRSHLLEEDEEFRDGGLSERAFDKHGETLEWAEKAAARAVARGDVSSLQWEIDDFLSSHGFEPLQGSVEHRKLSLRFLKEYRLAVAVQSARQAGDMVETPKPPESADRLSLMDLFDLYEGAKKDRLGVRTLRCYRQKLQAFSNFLPDRDARSLTDDDVYAWASHREKVDGVKPHIVQKNDVAAVSTAEQNQSSGAA